MVPILHCTVNNRDYKQVGPDTFYHVFNRGTAKMKIFLSPDDYGFFLSRLRECLYPKEIDRAELAKTRLYVRTQLPADAFDLICYCLMPNHFHFLLHQNTELPVNKLIGKLCTGYSKYFNKKYERVGSLFQDQFKSVPITSNEQLLWVSSYIHRNPLEAGLVPKLEEYAYSSYPDFVGLRSGTLCKKEMLMEQCGNSPASYNKHMMNFNEGIHVPLMLDSD
ncbi:MAG: transposase [bacterium]|nr:transposase [bacterium]